MQIPIPCECGNRLLVSESQAGSHATCKCGRQVLVPSLQKLRLISISAGGPATRAMVEAKVASGELPLAKKCAGCGCETECRIDVWMMDTVARGSPDFATT